MNLFGLRKPLLLAGIVLSQAVIAAAAHFFVLPLFGMHIDGPGPGLFIFLAGTLACLLTAAIALRRDAGDIRFADIADSIRPPLFVLDGGDRYILLNASAARLLGLDPRMAMGRPVEARLLRAINNAGQGDDFIPDATLAFGSAVYQTFVCPFANVDSDRIGRRLVFLRDVSIQFTIRETVREINRIMTLLGENTRKITGSAGTLTQGATLQTHSLAGITARMDEFAKKIQGNTEAAEKSTQLAAQAREAAERSGGEIALALTAMTDVQDAGVRIARIVKLIDDIAFQTNLLALNAAVEAARAGRQGKGFAVVADEVRNLAGRSAKAAKDTATMVEDVTERIGNASAYISKLEEMLGNILQDSIRMADSAAASTAKSSDQASGILQVNRDLGQVSAATGDTMSAVEQTASFVDELNRQVGDLRGKVEELVARFFPSGTEGASSSPEFFPLDDSRPERDGRRGASSGWWGDEQGSHSDDNAGLWEYSSGGEDVNPFRKRAVSGRPDWDLRDEMGGDDSESSLSSLLDSDGYDKEYKTLLESAINGGGRGKNGENYSDLFPGEITTGGGDRVIKPDQQIKLDDSEFGRY